MLNYFQRANPTGNKMDIEENKVETVAAKPWIEK